MVKYHKITNLLSGMICNSCKTGIEKDQTCWETDSSPSFRIHDLCHKKLDASNAYEKWSAEDDLFVKEKTLAGVSSNEIAESLKRKRNAITSRVKHFTNHENSQYDAEFTLKLRRKHYSLIKTDNNEEHRIIYLNAKFENKCQKCDKDIKIGDIICKPENSKEYFIHEWHLHDHKFTNPLNPSSSILDNEFDWESYKNNECIVTTKKESSPQKKKKYLSTDPSQSLRIGFCPKCKKSVYRNSDNKQETTLGQWEHKKCTTEKDLDDKKSERIFFGDTSEFVHNSELEMAKEKAAKKAEQDYYEKKRDERASRDN